MFNQSRLELIKMLDKVQGLVCEYSVHNKPSNFCDCKFGVKDVGLGSASRSEETGCPEIRQTIAIFKVMADDEYETFYKRLEKIKLKKFDPRQTNQKMKRIFRDNKVDNETMEIEYGVNKVLAVVLNKNKDKIKSQQNLVDDLGTDSLDTVEMIMKLEDHFDIEILDEEAEHIKTVQQIYDYIEKKLNG